MFNFPGPEIAVPFFIFAMIFGIVFVSSYFRSRQRIARYQAIEKLIDKADALPHDIYEDLKVSLYDGKQKSEYKSGLVLCFIGIALMAFFALQAFEDAEDYYLICIGLFPLAVGVAKLLNCRHEERKLSHPHE